MVALRLKLLKQDPDQLEIAVAQALIDLENNSADLRPLLRPLQLTSVKEVRVTYMFF